MAALAEQGVTTVGVDLSPDLLRRASSFGPVILSRAPPLDFLRRGCLDGVVISLVLEHLPDEEAVFSAAASVVRAGGVLVVVMNHPVWTAPGSTPILDESGETLWRTGRYLSRGHSDERAGEGLARFHHRPLSSLLTAAASAGWRLRRVVERGVSAEQALRHPGLGGQEHIPRLLGARWERA